MSKQVVVLDYGFGNVQSALWALERVGASAQLSADPDAVLNADGLVVPGVGAFNAVMEGLEKVKAPYLIERRLAGGRPVLGICVGLQVMFAAGSEHGKQRRGMGQWGGQVTQLKAPVLPHMGWSKVKVGEGSTLFEGVEDERFYFVHSYAAKTDPATFLDTSGPTKLPVTTWANHGEDFVAAVENGPLCGTQFHPEKSAEAGAVLLQNWLRTL